MNSKYYGFWLLFEEKQEDTLGQYISQLSNKYLDGSIFGPHLSIFPSIQIELDELVDRLSMLLQNVQKFDVKTKGISYEDRWSKTLFIDIELSEHLSNLNEILNKSFQSKLHENNIYHPHVSLIYKENMAEYEKIEAMKNIQIPKILTIKSLGIVDPGVTGNSWRDFCKWKVIEEMELRV